MMHTILKTSGIYFMTISSVSIFKIEVNKNIVWKNSWLKKNLSRECRIQIFIFWGTRTVLVFFFFPLKFENNFLSRCVLQKY